MGDEIERVHIMISVQRYVSCAKDFKFWELYTQVF